MSRPQRHIEAELEEAGAKRRSAARDKRVRALKLELLEEARRQLEARPDSKLRVQRVRELEAELG